jgi:hypothetical protein
MAYSHDEELSDCTTLVRAIHAVLGSLTKKALSRRKKTGKKKQYRLKSKLWDFPEFRSNDHRPRRKTSWKWEVHAKQMIKK